MSVCLDSDIHNIGCREINKLSFLKHETGDLCMNNHFMIAQLSRTYKGNVCLCMEGGCRMCGNKVHFTELIQAQVCIKDR